MKLDQFLCSLLMTSSVVAFVATPAQAQKVPNSEKPEERSHGIAQTVNKKVETLAQALSKQVVQITGVKLNSTETGFEVILETSQGEQLQVVPKTEGNIYTIDIPSAQLSGETFRQEKPISGIAEVVVSNQNSDTISIQVIGETALPKIELFDADEGLIFGITASTSTAQSEPTPTETAVSRVVEVKGVRLNSTDENLEVILETSQGEKLKVTPKNEGNTYIVDIISAQLRLPSGDTFRQQEPFEGIKNVIVNNLDENTIRVAVTGVDSIPKVELFDSDEGLIFSAIPTTSASQTQESTPETETQPEEPAAQNNEPIELIVTGQQDGYFVPEATTGTKIDVPLRDVPASVQVIPKEVIEDRQVIKLNELADNVSGVEQQGTYGGLASQGYFIRGFASEFESLRNGFRDFGFISPRDVANIDRVEFLKGPASILYGSITSPGGVVNTITKKPLSDPFYQINGTIGSYDFYRGTIDLTGPLTENRSALYRLNAAYQNADNFRDFVENESVFVAPSLTVNVGEKTNITFDYEYQKYDFTFDRGFRPNRVIFNLPISRFLGEPDDKAETTSNGFTYTLESKFGYNDNWKFRQGLNILNVTSDEQTARPVSIDEDGRTLNRAYSVVDQQQRNISFQNEISGKFNTGSIKHNVLLGFEIANSRFEYDFLRGDITPIDIFNPVYGARPENITQDFAEQYGSDTIALYFQNLIELTPNIKFLAGGRFDWADTFYEDKLSDTTFNETSESEFSPRLGIVYQPSDSTSVYASWTNSFNPQIFSRSRTDEPFKPETGEQFEVGIKQEFFNRRLSATLAYFDITKKNVLTTDPVDPDFSIQTGEQKSRGVNLDIVGEILPGWKIIGSYAYTDAFVSEDNDPTLVDNRLVGVPYNSASLWTTYEFQKGSLQGLGLGLGLVYSGEREATLLNDIEIPSYVRADASIFYKGNNFNASLNFKNLFDKKYYNPQGFFIVPAEPFTVLGKISVEF